jgi:hypothetical protein
MKSQNKLEIDRIKFQHQYFMDKIELQHKDEMDELRRKIARLERMHWWR